MENIVLPYVGEIIIIRETKRKAKVKKVTYIDNNTERSIKIKTDLGEFKLHEICENCE